jgi:predicted membrane protein
MFDRTVDTGGVRTFGWTRLAALVAAGVVSLALMLDPYVLQGVSLTRVHAGLPLLLLGVSGAYVHGFGFRPAHPISRAAVHPLIVLSLFVIGFVVLTGS